MSSADSPSVKTDTLTFEMSCAEIDQPSLNRHSFHQYIDDSLNEVLEEMKKFEADVMTNFNKDVEHNLYRQLVTQWTDLVKIKLASAEQIWEEMQKKTLMIIPTNTINWNQFGMNSLIKNI